MSYEETWAAAAEADTQIAKHFEHWLALARGLHDMREHLRARSGANTDASPLYRRAYAEWIPARPWAAKWSGDGKSSFRAACYWLIENQTEVETWRASLSERDRDRWQAPETLMREYRKSEKARAATPGEPPTKPETPLAALKRENAELKAKVERMERSGGESRFTLGSYGTSPAEIVRIIDEMERAEHRFEAIFQGLAAARNRRKELRSAAKKAKTTHAG
jgi:hypothetical protein